VGKTIPHLALNRLLKPADGRGLLERSEIREKLLPKLIHQTENLADHYLKGIVAQARQAMTHQLDHEISRLKDLQKVNRSVRTEEIELLMHQRHALDQHLGAARLRLDSLRLIHRGTN